MPGAWAPTAATWGVENRTTAIRVIPGEKSQRSEFRIGPADANPYLALAAALGAGIYGIEHKLALPPVIEGNACWGLRRNFCMGRPSASRNWLISPICGE